MRYLFIALIMIMGAFSFGQTPKQLTNLADIPSIGKVVPLNYPGFAWGEGRPGDGNTNGYSTFNPVNSTGEYLMVYRTDASVGVVNLKTGKYECTIPLTQYNPVYSALQPRWDRSPGYSNHVIYSIGNRLVRQPFNSFAAAETIITLVSPKIFYPDGHEEGDVTIDGKYLGTMICDPYNPTTKFYENIECVVVDIVGRKLLPGRVTQRVNAFRMSPDGKYSIVLPHDGLIGAATRYYRTADVAAGDMSKPIHVDSATKWMSNLNGQGQSVGHTGHAVLSNGRWVLTYQDNVDDLMKYFDPETGKSKAFFRHADMAYGGQHMCSGGPANKVIMSTYDPLSKDIPGQQYMYKILVFDLPTSTVQVLGSTATVRATNVNGDYYFTEAWASTDGKNVYWASNKDGADNLEVVSIPIGPAPIVTPVPTPVVTPTPTPAPGKPGRVWRVEGSVRVWEE